MSDFAPYLIATIVSALTAISVIFLGRKFLLSKPVDPTGDARASLDTARNDAEAERLARAKEATVRDAARRQEDADREAAAKEEKEARNASEAVERARDHLRRSGFFDKR